MQSIPAVCLGGFILAFTSPLLAERAPASADHACTPPLALGRARVADFDWPTHAPRNVRWALGALQVANWEGRFDRRDPFAPACAWTNCGISLQLQGTGLDVALSGAGGITFYVSVDGVDTGSFTTVGGEWSSSDTVTSYRVVSDLKPGFHEVALHRGPEGFFGPVAFHRATVLAGRARFEPRHGARRLEVIGDSISAGYGNLGCEFSAATEDGAAAYGPVAGQLIGAEVRVEAVSGIGLALNLDGSTTETMPELWGYSVPYDTESGYSCRQWSPDAVVINLGTNDFNAGIAAETYVSAYERFVHRVRACYPGALILCAINDETDLFSSSLDRVVADLADPKVQKINLNTPNWAGCDGHPDLAAHEAMGVTLAARLGEALGW